MVEFERRICPTFAIPRAEIVILIDGLDTGKKCGGI
jgi:hypothetical protein